MTVIKQEGRAACTPHQLFSLINAVEQYPKFLSWCKEVTITSRNPSVLKAAALIQKYGISFHCSFIYTLRSKNEIIIGLPSGGPFSSVSGLWRFHAVNQETQFSFELKLEHQSTWWINFFLIPILKNEVKSLIKLFEQRALRFANR